MKQASAMRLRSETEFLRRHNNRDVSRQKKIRSIKVQGTHLILICLMLSLIGLAIFKTARFLLTWDKLNVKTVRLVNGPQHGLHKVKGLLTYFRGNILSLSVERLRREMLAIREVKDVAISRVLPSTIVIHFILRQPIFQVLINNTYHLIDDEEVTLYTTRKASKDLMTVRGAKKDDIHHVVSQFGELKRIRRDLDYVGFRQPYGVVVKLKGIAEVFYPGETNYLEKIEYFKNLKNRLGLDRQPIKAVDMRFDDRYYLEFEEEVSR